MRRAKILVKPNIGVKVSTGPADKVTSAPVEASAGEVTGTQSTSTCSTDQIGNESSKGLISIEVSSLAKCSAIDVDSGADTKGHTNDKLCSEIIDTSSAAGAPQQIIAEHNSGLSGNDQTIDNNDKPGLIKAEKALIAAPKITSDTAFEISGATSVVLSKNDRSPHKKQDVNEVIAPVLEHSGDNLGILPLTKLPARRLKSHWKPNVMKVSTSAKPSVGSDLSKTPEAHDGLAAGSTTFALIDVSNVVESAETVACSSSVDSSTIHHRTVDALASPTSIIRRGKFAAKPNVAKAARVRQKSVGETSGSFSSSSASAGVLKSSGSSVIVIAPGGSTDELVLTDGTKALTALVDHSQFSSSGMNTLDEECGSGAATVNSSALNMSPEKVAAKMIERKIKQQRKKRRLLEQLVGPVDRKTVCIRDLIYMNPVNNPMAPPVSMSSGSLSTPSTQPGVSKLASASESSSAVASDDDDENYAPVPQVKVGPDGKIILNFDSVVLEEKKSQVEEKLEVVDESNLIRHGYPKKNRCRLWDTKETRKFYLLLSQIGTDFSLMCRRFPNRSRADLKKKFKREEKIHHELIERALGERRGLDITLLAEPGSASSSEEDESIAVTAVTKAKKPGRKRKAGTKEVQPEPETNPSDGQAVATIPAAKKGQGDGKPKKKKKTKRARYYDSSSDTNEDDVTPVQSTSSDATALASSTLSPVTLPPAGDPKAATETSGSESDNEVEIIKHICGRPTKSGRIPRPSVIREENELQDALSMSPSPAQIHKTSPLKQAASIIGSTPVVVKGNPISGWSSSSTGVSTVADLLRTPGPRTSLPNVSHVTPQFLASPVGLSPGGMLGANRLPSGVYVVLESPQPSASDAGGTTDGTHQVLYHIFAEMSSPAQGSPGLISAVANGGNLTLPSSSSPCGFVPPARPLPHSVPHRASTDVSQIRPLDAASQVFRPLNTVRHPIQISHSPRGLSYATLQPVPLSQYGHIPVPISGHPGASNAINMQVRTPFQAGVQYPQYPNLFAFPGTPPVIQGFVNNTRHINASKTSGGPVHGYSSPTVWTSSAVMPIDPRPPLHLQSNNSPAYPTLVGDFSGRISAPSNSSHTLITTRQQDGTVVIFSEPMTNNQQEPGSSIPLPSTQHLVSDVVKKEEAGSASSTRTIRVIEHQDGSTELLIDGGSCENDANFATKDGDDDSQYIDVVVEHYPISDSTGSA